MGPVSGWDGYLREPRPHDDSIRRVLKGKRSITPGAFDMVRIGVVVAGKEPLYSFGYYYLDQLARKLAHFVRKYRVYLVCYDVYLVCYIVYIGCYSVYLVSYLPPV